MYLNDLENHRTETEHEDALIMKAFFFQFSNSYSALFYIAFVKGLPQGVSLFGAFGQVDPTTGKPYTDACGVKGTADQPWSNVIPGCDPEVPEASALDSMLDGLLGDGNTTASNACKYLFVKGDCMSDLYTQVRSPTHS